MTSEGHFAVLGGDECRQLVRGGSVGRVAWTSETAGPLIIPVNYWVEGELVCFLTAPGSVLAQLANRHDVAFQIDDFDDESANGWSVLVQGHSQAHVADPDEHTKPWAIGVRKVGLAIVPDHYSGRAVSASE